MKNIISSAVILSETKQSHFAVIPCLTRNPFVNISNCSGRATLCFLFLL